MGGSAFFLPGGRTRKFEGEEKIRPTMGGSSLSQTRPTGERPREESAGPDSSLRPGSGGDPEALEAGLVTRARRGDAQAFRGLVEIYQDRIFNLCRRLLGPSRDQAEDMAQEIFLRAWKGLPSFSGTTGFGPWLRRIALNFWVQQHRRRTALKRKGTTLSLDAPLGGKDSDFFLQPSAREGDPVRATASRELGRAILEALETLDGEMREVLVLRDMEGYSYEEIAQALGIPIGTVRSRIHRARLKLQPLLRKFL